MCFTFTVARYGVALEFISWENYVFLSWFTMVPKPHLAMVLLSTCLCVCYRKRLLTLHTAGGKPGQAALIYTPFVFIAKSAKSPIRYIILPVPVSLLRQSRTRELPQILNSSWYQSCLIWWVPSCSFLNFISLETKHNSQTNVLSSTILKVINWLNSALWSWQRCSE